MAPVFFASAEWDVDWICTSQWNNGSVSLGLFDVGW